MTRHILLSSAAAAVTAHQHWDRGSGRPGSCRASQHCRYRGILADRDADQAPGRASSTRTCPSTTTSRPIRMPTNPPGEPAFPWAPGHAVRQQPRDRQSADQQPELHQHGQTAPTPPSRSGSTAPRRPPPTRTMPIRPSSRPMTAARPTCFRNTPARPRRAASAPSAPRAR